MKNDLLISIISSIDDIITMICLMVILSCILDLYTNPDTWFLKNVKGISVVWIPYKICCVLKRIY